MEKDALEIKNAIYTGICIYKKLSSIVVAIEEEIVKLEDKKYLSLYLGIIHSENSISNLFLETNLKKDTNLKYKRLEEKETLNIYNKIFKESLVNLDFQTLENYFYALLKKDIVIKLNRDYNFNPYEFIRVKNKTLVKK